MIGITHTNKNAVKAYLSDLKPQHEPMNQTDNDNVSYDLKSIRKEIVDRFIGSLCKGDRRNVYTNYSLSEIQNRLEK